MSPETLRPVADISDDEARVMCAEACGWIYRPGSTLPWALEKFEKGGQYQFFPPDYCRDLRACADLRAALTTEQQRAFVVELDRIVNPGRRDIYTEAFAMLDAKPRQIVNAVLVAMNLALP